MTKKIGRNEPCGCGSGKKYKKCCLKKTDKWKKDFDRLTYRDKISVPKVTKTQPFVRNIKNLEDGVKSVIRRFLQENSVVKLGCWWNSSHLSVRTTGINVVHGFYGYSVPDEVRPEFDSVIETGLGKQLPNGWYEFRDEDGEYWYDPKNGKQITRHSWNEYKGIHFDLTKEFDPQLSDEWIDYYPVQVESTESMDMEERKVLHEGIHQMKLGQVILNTESRLNEIGLQMMV
jgi:hypothetical protein